MWPSRPRHVAQPLPAVPHHTSRICVHLVQVYLTNAKLSELTHRTIETLRHEEALGLNAAIVYAGHFFATFDLDEYTHILLHLRPAPLERMRKWIRLFRQSKTRPPA